MNYDQIATRFEEYRRYVTAISPGVKGAVIGILDSACGGKENRYLLSKALTGKIHSSDWDGHDWNAMYQLAKPEKDDFTGRWVSGTENLSEIVRIVLEKMARQEGQTEMFMEVSNEKR